MELLSLIKALGVLKDFLFVSVIERYSFPSAGPMFFFFLSVFRFLVRSSSYSSDDDDDDDGRNVFGI